MSDFEPRPKGTVMYGAFDAFTSAERALRVLKNAGYARAAFTAGDIEERPSDEPTVVVVDAAAAGAVRAAEILEEFGARIRFAAHAPQVQPAIIAVQQALDVDVVAPVAAVAAVAAGAPVASVVQAERKPRLRKSARLQLQQPSVPAPSEPLAWDNVLIVTRPIEAIESVATDV